jgi:nucleoid-associated protein YgaU
VENLKVEYDGKTSIAVLTGVVDSQATREKAILLAGNVDRVEKVDDRLTMKAPAAAPTAAPPEPPKPVFYTVQKGDSLSKIAKAHYGDANKWPALFEANKEVIKNPDLIYPGQQIRVPKV